MLKQVQHDRRKNVVILNSFQDLTGGGLPEMLKQVQHDRMEETCHLEFISGI
jgi:hypothetical protein